MNYKLAKQLKDKGFPQNILLGSRYYDETIREVCKGLKGFINSVSMGDKEIEEWVKIPTLSELIDECEKKVEGFYFNLQKWDNRWEATAFLPTKPFKGAVMKKAKTPQIAVAKLWLKLNETPR